MNWKIKTCYSLQLEYKTSLVTLVIIGCNDQCDSVLCGHSQYRMKSHKSWSWNMRKSTLTAINLWLQQIVWYLSILVNTDNSCSAQSVTRRRASSDRKSQLLKFLLAELSGVDGQDGRPAGRAARQRAGLLVLHCHELYLAWAVVCPPFLRLRIDIGQHRATLHWWEHTGRHERLSWCPTHCHQFTLITAHTKLVSTQMGGCQKVEFKPNVE